MSSDEAKGQGSGKAPSPRGGAGRQSGDFDPDAALAEARAREAMEVLRSRERAGPGGVAPESPAALGSTFGGSEGEEPGGLGSVADIRGGLAERSLPPAHWTRSGASEIDDPLPFPDPAEEGSLVDTARPDDDGGEDDEAGVVEAPRVEVDPDSSEFETAEDPRIPSDQEDFRIGEVARIVGVKPYVLRYWETEFECVEPRKTSTNQRRYGRADVARLLQIRRLRHEAKLTVAQTRSFVEGAANGNGRRIPVLASEALATSLGPSDAPLGAGEAQRLRARLAEMRQAVLELLEAVDE